MAGVLAAASSEETSPTLDEALSPSAAPVVGDTVNGRPVQVPAAASNGSNKNVIRSLSLSSSKDAAPSSAVKLSVRKLSFDSHQTRLAKAAPAEAASSSEVLAPAGEGLPSMLKKLRQDAQREIQRALAGTSQLHECLAREIRLLEQTLSAQEACHKKRVADLEAAHKQQVDELSRDIEERAATTKRLEDEKRAVEGARDETVRPSSHTRPRTHAVTYEASAHTHPNLAACLLTRQYIVTAARVLRSGATPSSSRRRSQ